jgi:hypothetical protein
VEADDRGHLERSRQNRGVIGAAAGVRGKAANLGPVDLRSQRRRELVGNEHGRLVHLAQQIAGGGHAVPQVHAQPPHQIGDVAFPLAQVGIGDLVEHRAELLEHLLERPFGIDLLLADERRGAREQHRIVEHQHLRVEERRQLGTAPALDPLTDGDELFARLNLRPLEPRQFVLEPLRRDPIAQRLRALTEHHCPSRDHPRRDADAAQAVHASSPNPPSINAVSAATAASSSTPSAVIVTIEPRAAASSRMPMMLLPSISRPCRATRIRAS